MACRAWGWLALATVIAGASVQGCADGGAGGGGRRDAGRPTPGTDAGDGGGGVEDECRRDEDCEDDGQFCNGIQICRNGQCILSGIPTCDDSVACTVDSCSPTANACQNIPDSSRCPSGLACFANVGCSNAPACEFDPDCGGDGMFCNGAEVCIANRCTSPGMRDCSDPNSCTMDECVEAMQDCAHTPYDYLNDPLHCGPTGEDDCVPCPIPSEGAPHVASACVEGMCGFACEEGWYDTDGNPGNGCECNTPPGTPDDPDDLFQDTNCDGIDGDELRAIFVATTGRDTYPGTRAQPKRTLTAGIQAARDAGFDVYVSVGVYTVVETLELANGVSVYGGYDAAMNWRRSDSTIPQVAGPSVAVRASGLSDPTIVDRIDVVAASNTANGGASIGVHAIDSPGLVWRVSTVQAGQGGPGAAGGAGMRGADGANGRDSIGGVEYDGPLCSRNPRPNPPPGGLSACGRTGGAGGAGGDSGVDGNHERGPKDGAPGVGGTSGGPRGARPRADGSPGTAGSNGAAGEDGAAGSATGAILGGAWGPGNGAPGADGVYGNGGGGGGGGGGDTTGLAEGFCNTSGDTGASGGGGGCGGTAGVGGGGGGASIGFLLVRSSATLELIEIRTAAAGDGGVGGRGGDGGSGGAGGLSSAQLPQWAENGGVRDEDGQGHGGAGGSGGQGGRGGHGGGGAGGPSVGILRDSASAISTSLLTYVLGNAGNGGSSPGNPGPRGARMNEVVL